MNVDAHIFTTREGKIGCRLDWTGPDGQPRRFVITPTSSMVDFTLMRAALSGLAPEKLRTRRGTIPGGAWS